MNLEKMLIGKKPRGWELENRNRNYWNKLELEISKQPHHRHRDPLDRAGGG